MFKKIKNFFIRSNSECKNAKQQGQDRKIILAIGNRDFKTIKSLIDSGADVNVTNSNGKTALYLAISNECNDKIIELLITNTNMNTQNNNNVLIDLISLAIRLNRPEIVKLLIDSYSVDINSGNFLHVAVRHNYVEIIKLLLEYKVSVDVPNDLGKTPLMLAIENCREEVVQLLLKHSNNVNAKDYNGKTALTLAIECMSLRIIKLLLSNKNISITDMEAKAALTLAIENGNATIVSLILNDPNINIDINFVNESGSTFLHIAARYGYSTIAKLLIDAKANINAQSNSGNTPLTEAVRSDKLAVVELLLNEGADFDIVDNEGNTALVLAAKYQYVRMLAIKCNHIKIFKNLLDRGADINIKDKGDKTALIWAAENGNITMVQLLLSKLNIDIDSKDKDGNTALHFTARRGYNSIIELLVAAGADINAQNNYGQTALIKAVRSNILEATNLETIELLLNKYNADVNVVDENNYTALVWAAENYNVKAVRLLLEYGACEVGVKSDHKVIRKLLSVAEKVSSIINNLDNIMNNINQHSFSSAVKEHNRNSNGLFLKNLVANIVNIRDSKLVDDEFIKQLWADYRKIKTVDILDKLNNLIIKCIVTGVKIKHESIPQFAKYVVKLIVKYILDDIALNEYYKNSKKYFETIYAANPFIKDELTKYLQENVGVDPYKNLVDVLYTIYNYIKQDSTTNDYINNYLEKSNSSVNEKQLFNIIPELFKKMIQSLQEGYFKQEETYILNEEEINLITRYKENPIELLLGVVSIIKTFISTEKQESKEMLMLIYPLFDYNKFINMKELIKIINLDNLKSDSVTHNLQSQAECLKKIELPPDEGTINMFSEVNLLVLGEE